MAVTSMIGARIQRREDPKLITGHGNFIDDVNLVNMAHMSIVRSPHAHARIKLDRYLRGRGRPEGWSPFSLPATSNR